MKKLKRSLLRFRSILALAASVILLAPFACSEPESTPQPPPIIPLEETLTPADIIADDGPTGEDIPLSGEADLVEESTTYFTVQMGAFSTRENAETAAEELVSLDTTRSSSRFQTPPLCPIRWGWENTQKKTTPTCRWWILTFRDTRECG